MSGTEHQLRNFVILLGVAAGAFLLGRTTTPQPVAEPALEHPVSDGKGTYLPGMDPTIPVFYRPRRNLVTTDPIQKEATRVWLAGLKTRDAALLREARGQYVEFAKIAPVDTEVHTYIWLIDYLLAETREQISMLSNSPNGARIIKLFGGPNLPDLPKYLRLKHGMDKLIHRNVLRLLDETVRFLSPARDEWEQTSKLLDVLQIQPGQTITDVGAGSGYFTWIFSDAVGPRGKVHAIEINQLLVEYLSNTASDEQRDNVRVHKTNGSRINAAPSTVDHIFMCATFQTIYANLETSKRQKLIAEIRAALKPGGKLTIMESSLDYQGPNRSRGTLVAKQIIVAYLEASGFKLVASHQFVPQRYTLIFEADSGE